MKALDRACLGATLILYFSLLQEIVFFESLLNPETLNQIPIFLSSDGGENRASTSQIYSQFDDLHDFPGRVAQRRRTSLTERMVHYDRGVQEEKVITTVFPPTTLVNK